MFKSRLTDIELYTTESKWKSMKTNVQTDELDCFHQIIMKLNF